MIHIVITNEKMEARKQACIVSKENGPGRKEGGGKQCPNVI
jgi:hypothetical protein